eukprot:scaffold36829_cov29-Tisochrysis_lutea.AAC.1
MLLFISHSGESSRVVCACPRPGSTHNIHVYTSNPQRLARVRALQCLASRAAESSYWSKAELRDDAGLNQGLPLAVNGVGLPRLCNGVTCRVFVRMASWHYVAPPSM